MPPIRSYRDLEVWQRSMRLAQQCFRVARACTDRFELLPQLRKAAISIPANIAEGHGRRSRGAYCNHLQIALGSLAELETLLELARRTEMLTLLQTSPLNEDADHRP